MSATEAIARIVKRAKDENVGQKDRMVHVLCPNMFGEGYILRYIGPCTLAHASYIKKDLLKNDPELTVNIIELEKPETVF